MNVTKTELVHSPSAQEAKYFPLLAKSMLSTCPVCPFNDVSSQECENPCLSVRLVQRLSEFFFLFVIVDAVAAVSFLALNCCGSLTSTIKLHKIYQCTGRDQAKMHSKFPFFFFKICTKQFVYILNVDKQKFDRRKRFSVWEADTSCGIYILKFE